MGRLLAGPDSSTIAFFVAYGMPILATVVALFFWTRTSLWPTLGRFVCAFAALGALSYGYFQVPGSLLSSFFGGLTFGPGEWLIGSYATETALAVAVIASGVQLVIRPRDHRRIEHSA